MRGGGVPILQVDTDGVSTSTAKKGANHILISQVICFFFFFFHICTKMIIVLIQI